MLSQFNHDVAPAPAADVGPPTQSAYDNVNYEEYFYLPDEYSVFLIKFGSDADDLAIRYNKLLLYTKGLLTSIEQTNQVSIIKKQ